MFSSTSILPSLTLNLRDFLSSAGIVFGVVALLHIVPYLVDKRGVRRYPGSWTISSPLVSHLARVYSCSRQNRRRHSCCPGSEIRKICTHRSQLKTP
ncbi:hypothetical protein BDY19DRAFT_957707 [Irpex rosettiformis]|uniref:Uncharacterized protein n=1 Tax=Irpex rosettiformis TaxID=378272 RepID=A0ACB8TYB5_9APHY|nr:hypothetical protein BDY19DRAFT_957707 [Irpex rosettiformis]